MSNLSALAEMVASVGGGMLARGNSTDVYPSVVGIDAAITHTGVAIIERHHGTCYARTFVVVTRPCGVSIAERHRRITSVASRVDALIPRGAQLALIEAPALDANYGDAWTRAGAWWFIIHQLRRREIPVTSVVPTTLKRWVTGYGGSPKKPVTKTHIILGMRAMWPKMPCTATESRDHECEALAMAHMCAQHLGWPVPVRAHHGDPLEVIDWPARLPS